MIQHITIVFLCISGIVTIINLGFLLWMLVSDVINFFWYKAKRFSHHANIDIVINFQKTADGENEVKGYESAEHLSDKECVETLQALYSLRKKVPKESVRVEITAAESERKFYHVQYSDQDFTTEMDEKTISLLNELFRSYRLIG